jgi:hypothetical protein
MASAAVALIISWISSSTREFIVLRRFAGFAAAAAAADAAEGGPIGPGDSERECDECEPDAARGTLTVADGCRARFAAGFFFLCAQRP